MKDDINEQLNGLETTLDTLEGMVASLEAKLRILIDQKIKVAQSIGTFTAMQKELEADKYGVANEIANDIAGEF